MSESRLDWWPPLEDGTQPADTAGQGHAQVPEPPRRSRSRDRARRTHERSQARRSAIAAVVTVVVLLGGAVFIASQFIDFGGGGGAAEAAIEDYPGPGYPSATVVVNAGDTGAAMAATLVDAGVVASQKAFTDAFAANPDAAKIQPGTYTLLREMKASDAVLGLLNPASRVSIKVTIPEGFTVRQIVTRINEVTLIPVADLEAALADPASFGLPAEAEGNAEGWLFPSTYQVDPKATASDVLRQMASMTVQILQNKQVPQEQWKDVLTKASLIEREAGRAEDRPKMARAIDNRLAQSWPLEIDASVSYGAGRTSGAPTGAELEDASNPYNTYQHNGLPPTPIAAPGEAAIQAVLAPEEGTWMFWCTVNFDTKETKFGTTLAEHNQCVAEMNAWIAEYATPTATP